MGRRDEKGHEKLWGVINIFIILTLMLVSGIYICVYVKTEPNCTLVFFGRAVRFVGS